MSLFSGRLILAILGLFVFIFSGLLLSDIIVDMFNNIFKKKK